MNLRRLAAGVALALGASMTLAGPAGSVENPGDVKNCDDFETLNDAAAWFWTYYPEHGDVAGLDSDGDTIPCESRPRFASTAPYVDIDLSAGEDGLYLTHTDGTVDIEGKAVPFGDRPSLAPGEQVTAMAVTPDGDGYWLFTNRGNAFNYGAAQHFGDVGHLTLDGDVIDAIATADGNGYYMIAEDGGIFAFGSAVFYGSIPEILAPGQLAAPVVGMSATESGYVLVAADGGAFNFGDSQFYGSVPEVLPGVALASPVISLVPGPAGYLMLGGDGGIFNFGTSEFHGSLSGVTSDTVVGVAVKADLSGYLILDASGTVWALGDTRHIGVDRYEGTGGTVVSLNPEEPSILYLSHSGASNFQAWAQDSANDNLDLLINEIGQVEAFVYLDTDDATRKIEVTADGDWTLESMPISYARHWRTQNGPLDGVGSDVIRATRPAAGATFEFDIVTSGHVSIWAYQIGGSGTDLLVNQVGSLTDHQVSYPNWVGHTILVVDADPGAQWSMAVG